MKIWKRLISGLLALTLLASLSCAALAAEPKAKTEKAAAKPSTQFSQWFSWLGADPENPESSEAVLAKMGTVINQTKTVGGETLTLNGAVWNGDSVQLSLTAKSSNFPKELTEKSLVHDDACAAKMPEKQWKDYAKKQLETKLTEEDLAKEGLETRLQNVLKQGQVVFMPSFGIASREGNALTLRASIQLEAVLEKTEMTLHIENMTLVDTDKATGMPLMNQKPAGTVLKGPFDFTFTLEKNKAVQATQYTGSAPVTCGKVPLRVTKVSLSPTGMGTSCGIDVQGPVNLVDGRNKPVSGKANIDLDEDLKLALNGLWTKDGKYVDCKESMGFTGVLTPADETGPTVNWNRKFPYPIDPATVTAVDVGGVRVELSALTAAAK